MNADEMRKMGRYPYTYAHDLVRSYIHDTIAWESKSPGLSRSSAAHLDKIYAEALNLTPELIAVALAELYIKREVQMDQETETG